MFMVELQKRASKKMDLRGLKMNELQNFLEELDQPKYRQEQIWRWLHQKGIKSFDDMKNIPLALRNQMKEKSELITLKVDTIQRSKDGTKKIRFLTQDGKSIESVLIPDGDTTTQCISSQVGCALDCQFCATAKLGFTRHLKVGEIVDQVYRAKEILEQEEPGRRITNLVYMGMGEPLHNFERVSASIELLTHELGANMSYRKITVSTVGLVSGIKKLGELPKRPNLAISLNASDNETRDAVMPINKKWNIQALLQALREYPLENRRRLTFEYVLWAGVNDTDDDAHRLSRLLGKFNCKVNIIPWNPHPGAPYKRPTAENIERFQNKTKSLGLPTYLRTPRGDDIDAACGQLANRGALSSSGRTDVSATVLN